MKPVYRTCQVPTSVGTIMIRELSYAELLRIETSGEAVHDILPDVLPAGEWQRLMHAPIRDVRTVFRRLVELSVMTDDDAKNSQPSGTPPPTISAQHTAASVAPEGKICATAAIGTSSQPRITAPSGHSGSISRRAGDMPDLAHLSDSTGTPWPS